METQIFQMVMLAVGMLVMSIPLGFFLLSEVSDWKEESSTSYTQRL